MRLGFQACFTAGKPLYGPDGAKAIELFRSYEDHGDDCDRVVSRNEHADDGPLVLRRVLRRFARQALVLDLVAGGRTIGTTAEHPFFAKGKGWTAAQELRPGDEVRLMAPGWVTVESVADTGRWETVCNLEVEDDHTYFVGCEEWGWSVWAHNSEYITDTIPDTPTARQVECARSILNVEYNYTDRPELIQWAHGVVANAARRPGHYTTTIKWGATPSRAARPDQDGPGYWGVRQPQSNARVVAFEP